MTGHPHVIRADNPGPFTLDGTRTYRVGERRIAVIDPGPELNEHIEALVAAVSGADGVSILVTHGHADHTGAAPGLARRLDSPVYGPRGVDAVTHPLVDGGRVETDQGALVAVNTPGHTRRHLSYHWPGRRAVFAGDLLLGEGDTTWVAEYPGCVGDYLASLQRLRRLELDVIYPAHGPPLTEPEQAIDRFRRHREERIRQLREAREAHPDADVETLLDAVYGDTVPTSLRPAARRSLEALLDHLERSTG